FHPGAGGDVIDLSPIVHSLVDYHGLATGEDPVAQGYLRVMADGSGDTLVQLDPDLTGSWHNILVLDNVAPDQLTVDNFVTGYSFATTAPVDISDPASGAAINGTAFADTLSGSGGGDTINGGGG